ncbi:hypothetical protein DFQ28_006649 [Apophysomyces sp. BC1034]|nr:hypothetical protein DFQ30_004682 [Apophysomyces sp. BC1015]KAG0182546.1 hypothetical protein DFQ29_003548 [Apophysomyces sp. BC1021]KAG0193055.1 hypothetical protein DFQ28_006649 [Apophysomyces sp. BC1034]
MANPAVALPAARKFFTELPKLKVLSRPDDVRSEVTVYVKGFLSEGESPDNFEDWMHSHRLLVLSPTHQWGPAALGYSWPSGSPMAQIPLPLATLGSAAYLVGRNFRRLSHLRLPTPASILGAVAVDVGLHAARLAYQFNTAKGESRERAEMLAWRLLDLRRKHDKLRVVGHSLGCRHITEACGLMRHDERPDAVHLCAPAMVASDILPHVTQGTGGLGRESTAIYYSPKDITLGIFLRTILMGEHAIGEVGVPGEAKLDPSVVIIDASKSLGGYYVGAHTDYADKFHFFAFPRNTRERPLMNGPAGPEREE